MNVKNTRADGLGYWQRADLTGLASHRATVYCKMPGDPPGCYCEEIDVATMLRTKGAALKVAQAVIETQDLYAPELRPMRVRFNW
jgi:hypothetical protein